MPYQCTEITQIVETFHLYLILSRDKPWKLFSLYLFVCFGRYLHNDMKLFGY